MTATEQRAGRTGGLRAGAARADPYRPWALRWVQALGRLLLGCALRLRVVGVERVPAAGPVLLAGNHASFLDGPLVVALCRRPVRTLAKAELYVGPLGYALRVFGQIPVWRGRPDRTALSAAVAELRRGGVVGMFPEGARGSGRLEQVHDGVAYLALRTGAAIVPVACVGTAEAMPLGARHPRWRAPVTIVFGDPFHVDPPPNPHARSAMAAAAEDIRVRLATHLALATGLAAAAGERR